MAKQEKFTEPEERINPNPPIDSTIPTEEFDPMAGEKKTRSHTSSGVAEGSNQPMPEYNVNPNLDQPTEDKNNQQHPDADYPEDEIPPYEEYKKQEKNMSDADRLEQADFTAEFLLQTYSEGWRQIGNWTMPVKNKTRQKLYKDGIDPHMKIQMGATWIEIDTCFDLFNRDSTDQLKLDQKTIDKIKPIIAKELAKRGMVMPPLLYVGVVLLQHAGKMIMIIRKAFEQKEELIKAIKSTGKFYEQAARPQPHTPTQAAEPEPAPQPAEYVPPPEERTMNEFDKIQEQNRQKRRGKTNVPKKKGYKKRKHMLQPV